MTSNLHTLSVKMRRFYFLLLFVKMVTILLSCMTHSLSGSPIIDKNLCQTSLHTAGFGFSLYDGETLPTHALRELLYDDTAEEIWELANIFGFVQARVAGVATYESYWNSQQVFNNRQRVNVLPHKDATSFFLAANAPRSERTVIAPRDHVLTHFWDTLGMHAKKIPLIADFVDNARIDIQEIISRSSLMEDALTEDEVGRRLSKLVTDLSSDPDVHDDTLHALGHDLSDRLRQHQMLHEVTWDTGTILWVSKMPFHYRLCPRVAEISQLENPLFRHARRKDSKRDF